MSWDICPASDYISQPYGCVDYAGEWLVDVNTCSSQHFHAGVDLGHSQGGAHIFRTPVHATRAGTVVAVGTQYLGPYAVTVFDGQVYIEHGHLDEASVQKGQTVQVGDQLGLVGTQGASTAPHLHVEVRIDGPRQGNPDRYTVDPMPFLNPLGGDDIVDQAQFDAFVTGCAPLAQLLVRSQTIESHTNLLPDLKVASDQLQARTTEIQVDTNQIATLKTQLDAVKASGVGADPGVQTLIQLWNKTFK